MSTTESVSEQTGIRSYEDYKNTRTVNQNLGKDEFLQLLATQLQYQDPLEPTKDTDFIAQLAQFSSLQYLESLTSVMTTYQYYSLAGKYVYAEVKNEAEENIEVFGVVDRVIMSDGKAFAQVGDYLIDASKITQVFDSSMFSTSNPLLETSNLIGKSVSAYVTDSKGNYVTDDDGNKTVVSGTVTRVAIEKGSLVAYLDTDEVVKMGNIFDIQQ